MSKNILESKNSTDFSNESSRDRYSKFKIAEKNHLSYGTFKKIDDIMKGISNGEEEFFDAENLLSRDLWKR